MEESRVKKVKLTHRDRYDIEREYDVPRRKKVRRRKPKRDVTDEMYDKR